MKTKLLLLFGFLIFIGIISATAYFYFRYQKTSHELSLLKSSPPTNTQTDNIKIINAVTKIVELPASSPDYFYIIPDTTVFKGQPFFDQAKNGDALLLYNSVKKAVLYRPSTNKIVDIAPININSAGSNQVTGAVAGASIGIIPTVTQTPVQSP